MRATCWRNERCDLYAQRVKSCGSKSTGSTGEKIGGGIVEE